MLRYRLIYMLIVISIIFAISACGRVGDDEYNKESTGETTTEVLRILISNIRFQDPLYVAAYTI